MDEPELPPFPSDPLGREGAEYLRTLTERYAEWGFRPGGPGVIWPLANALTRRDLSTGLSYKHPHVASAPLPPEAFTSSAGKDELAEVLRRRLSKAHAIGVAICTESWTLSTLDRDTAYAWAGRVREHPDAREVVHISVEHIALPFVLVSNADILRDHVGRGTLGPWERLENVEWEAGRFAHILTVT